MTDSSGLSGTIPTTLGLLTRLKAMDLGENKVAELCSCFKTSAYICTFQISIA